MTDALGNAIFGCATTMSYRDFVDAPPAGALVCRIRKLPLIPGEYTVNLTLKDDKGVADNVDGASRFVVENSGMSELMNLPSRRWGNVVVAHEWAWQAGAGAAATTAATTSQS